MKTSPINIEQAATQVVDSLLSEFTGVGSMGTVDSGALVSGHGVHGMNRARVKKRKKRLDHRKRLR